MTAEAYPLQWPDGRKRTAPGWREPAPFDVTFARARDDIVREVNLMVTGSSSGRFGDPKLVISTNVALRRDGLPLAGQRQPEDPGVAIYFVRSAKQMAFACDRWNKVEHNMRAIVKTIEALRGIARWGTGDMLEAAYTGFLALPAPAARAWWQVLGVAAHAGTVEVIDAYRRLRSDAHRAGDTDRFDAVNRAYAQFQDERGLA